MYVDADAATASSGSRRHEAFAATAGELLGLEHLPIFSLGTDLALPASANEALRGTLEFSSAAVADSDLWLRLALWDRGCVDSEVHVPQLLAAVTFRTSRSGVAFFEPGGGNEGYPLEDEEGELQQRQQVVLKPRFGCQGYSEVRARASVGVGCRVCED